MGNLTPQQIVRFASILMALGVKAIERHAEAKNMTTEEALKDAEHEWLTAENAAEALLKIGQP